MKEIYVDGSCRKNPGPGSWAAIVVENDKVIDLEQSELFNETTNNRMEMSAILWAMSKHGNCFGAAPVVYTDSAYALNSFTTWLSGWKSRGWTKANGEPVENLDLIKMYDTYDRNGLQVVLKKITGHAGHKWNELADQLATRNITPREIISKYGR